MPYTVTYAGPDTCIIESPDGPFRTFDAAEHAAAEHLEEHLSSCRAVLWALRRAGSYGEYRWLAEEWVRPTA
jgi:hypothetical protein